MKSINLNHQRIVYATITAYDYGDDDNDNRFSDDNKIIKKADMEWERRRNKVA